MAVTIEQLRAFTYTAEYGSISEAARQLGKRHSSLSELIGNLEIELDLKLFDRSRRSVTLTEHGQALLKEAQSTLGCLAKVQNKASALHAGNEGRVTLAYNDYMLDKNYLLVLVQGFMEYFPLVTLELLNCDADEVYPLVDTGRAELGLIFYQGKLSYDTVGYCNAGEIAMVRVVGSEHPLAEKNSISNDDLAHYTKLYHTGQNTRTPVEHSDCTDSVLYCSSLYETLHLLENNIGWAILPSHVLESALRSGRVVAFDSESQTAAKPQLLAIDALWTQKRPLGSAAEWLKEKICQLPPPRWPISV